MNLSRRGLIGSLLAAPVIIRTPGLLMPIKASWVDDFTTFDTRVIATERYTGGYTDTRLYALARSMLETQLIAGARVPGHA